MDEEVVVKRADIRLLFPPWKDELDANNSLLYSNISYSSLPSHQPLTTTPLTISQSIMHNQTTQPLMLHHVVPTLQVNLF